MSLLDQHFEEALRDLPEKKLSFFADLRIKRMLKKRARELARKPSWAFILLRSAAVSLVLLFFVSGTGVYAFYSPSITLDHMLYPVKTWGERVFYPESKTPEERISYHLWINRRRWHEAEKSQKPEILSATLEEANKQVELAVLIQDEIADQQIHDATKREIISTLKGDQPFYERYAPKLANHQRKLLKHFIGEQMLLVRMKVEEFAEQDAFVKKTLQVHYELQKNLLQQQLEGLEAFLPNEQEQGLPTVFVQELPQGLALPNTISGEFHVRKAKLDQVERKIKKLKKK